MESKKIKTFMLEKLNLPLTQNKLKGKYCTFVFTWDNYTFTLPQGMLKYQITLKNLCLTFVFILVHFRDEFHYVCYLGYQKKSSLDQLELRNP